MTRNIILPLCFMFFIALSSCVENGHTIYLKSSSTHGITNETEILHEKKVIGKVKEITIYDNTIMAKAVLSEAPADSQKVFFHLEDMNMLGDKRIVLKTNHSQGVALMQNDTFDIKVPVQPDTDSVLTIIKDKIKKVINE